MGAAGGGGDVEFSLLGPDHDRIVELSYDIMDKIADVPGLTNIVSSHRPGRPELTFRPRYERMAEAGVTVQELATTLRASVEGIVATQYRDRNREYDLKVILDSSATDSEAKIANIPVVTPGGIYTLSQLTDIEFTSGPTMLLRKDKFSAVTISGTVTEGVTTGQAVGRIREIFQDDLQLPEGYRIDWGAQVEILDDTVSDMLGTFFLAMLLTYMLLVAILESFVQPLYILATLPLGLIGVFLAIVITGQTLSIVAMMAIIMLVGIVVNNAILLLDQTNRYVREGRGVRESLLEACPIKLKPVLMATLAIIFGMLPMALGIGASGKELRQPMGIVSIGGLIVSALLTLYVIPSVYYLFHRENKER
jgi:HAE1 family hydrophobic/amphiphilic exporter-1